MYIKFSLYVILISALTVTIEGTLELAIGEELRLTCRPNVQTDDIEFLWIYSYGELVNKTVISQDQTVKTTASIYETGTYTCQAKSKLGEAEYSVNVTVYREGERDRQVFNEAKTAPIIAFSFAALIIFSIVTALVIYRNHTKQRTESENIEMDDAGTNETAKESVDESDSADDLASYASHHAYADESVTDYEDGTQVTDFDHICYSPAY